MDSMLGRAWTFATPSMFALIGAIGMLPSYTDHMPIGPLPWGALAVLLVFVSMVSSFVVTVCLIVLLAKVKVPGGSRISALPATVVAWSCLALALKLIP